MLGVGIHPKVKITKVTKNDKGTLVITFKSGEEVNPIEALSGSGDGSFNSPEQTILYYGPKLEGFGNVARTNKELVAVIQECRAPLNHIAEVYLTVDKRKWDPFIGTNVTMENWNTVTFTQDTLDKVYDNLVNQFITMMTPVIGENSKPVNVLFVRQSKNKHYPRFRTKWLTSQPFIEDATATPSKLKFSDYEVKNGLDKGEVAGGAQVPSATEVEESDSVFK